MELSTEIVNTFNYFCKRFNRRCLTGLNTQTHLNMPLLTNYPNAANYICPKRTRFNPSSIFRKLEDYKHIYI